jgi:hypothetical protein
MLIKKLWYKTNIHYYIDIQLDVWTVPTTKFCKNVGNLSGLPSNNHNANGNLCFFIFGFFPHLVVYKLKCRK